MFVHSYVRLVQVCLEQSIFIFLGRRALRALRQHSENNQSIKIRVIQSEPKILRLFLFWMQDLDRKFMIGLQSFINSVGLDENVILINTKIILFTKLCHPLHFPTHERSWDNYIACYLWTKFHLHLNRISALHRTESNNTREFLLTTM